MAAWDNAVVVVVKKETTPPGDAEVQQTMTEVPAKHLLEITEKVPVSETNTNSPRQNR